MPDIDTARRIALLAPLVDGDLAGFVAAELGHADALDRFFPSGDIQARAVAPLTILHIVSGNTPEAGRQSLVRGLLLGSHNQVKLPSAGLPEFERFVESLPDELRALVECRSDVPEDWFDEADAVIVFGSDETVHHFRQQMGPRQKFVAHGHRVSFAVVLDDPDGTAATRAARDVSLFDQKGCLSPHCIYVRDDARAFAGRLAEAMAAFQKHTPRGPLTLEEEAQIFHLRASYRFRAASDPSVAMWESQDDGAWTVVFEDETQFALSCLNRFVFVKPLPDDLAAEIWLVRDHLSAIAVHPFDAESAEEFAGLGATRICALGRAQDPPLGWRQDGIAALADLVTWQTVDIP